MHFRRSLLSVVLAMAAAGCVQAVPQPAPASSLATAGPERPGLRVSSLTEIEGPWDIVSFDGYAPSRRLGGGGTRHWFVDVADQGLSFAIGCNYSGMRGHIEGGVLVRAPGETGIQTSMGCGREAEARDDAFFGFFRERPQVTLLPDGRMRMANRGRELLLERSSVRRLVFGPSLPEITGTWRVVSFLHFEGGGHRGWGAMYAPGRVTIGNSTLRYSRCPGAEARFAYGKDFVLRTESAPSSDETCAAASPPATEVEPLLAALLGQSPEAERISDELFVLRSRDYAVVLTSEAAYRREFGEQATEWERRPG